MIINLKKIEKIEILPEWKYPEAGTDTINKDGTKHILFGSKPIAKEIDGDMIPYPGNMYIDDEIYQSPRLNIHFSNNDQNRFEFTQPIKSIKDEFEVILASELSTIIKNGNQIISSFEFMDKIKTISNNLKEQLNK